MSCKYPAVEVNLYRADGNVFGVIGIVEQALRRAGVARSVIDEYIDEATSGDYDAALQATMRWVTVR